MRRNVLANRNLRGYFWYAAGEIALVVLGILIALQINNWNEERIEKNQIQEYVLSLVGDLQGDLQMLGPVAGQIQDLIDRSRALAEYMQGRTLDEISNLDLFIYTTSPSYRPFEWNRAALEQLKSSGALRQIKDQQLVRKISEYDALTKHLDLDYANDENNIREAVSVMLEVVDMNYPDDMQLPEVMDEITDSPQLPNGFRESARYLELKSADLPLLTNDLGVIKHAVNHFIDVGDALEARTEIEIPRLRKIASEIIELINAEYGP